MSAFHPSSAITDPLHALRIARMFGRMQAIIASAQELRARGTALVVIAVLTAFMIAGVWIGASYGPLLVPLLVAYFVFNFGFGVTVAMRGSLTRATRLGIWGILLNVLAMLLSNFETLWTVVSVSAVLMTLVSAYLLFKEGAAAAA